MSVALPDDSYLRKVGQVAYTVSSLEWTLIGDIGCLSAHLPPTMTLAKLAGVTTGAMAIRLARFVPDITSAEIAAYYEAGAKALARAAELRNDVLHARPSTIGADQRLYRWLPDRPEHVIDDAWIDEAIAELDGLVRSVGAVRPAL